MQTLATDQGSGMAPVWDGGLGTRALLARAFGKGRIGSRTAATAHSTNRAHGMEYHRETFVHEMLHSLEDGTFMYVTFQREEAKAVDRTAVAWTGSSGNLRPFWPSILHHRFAEKSQFHERQEAKARGSLRKAETEVFRGRGLVLPIEGNRHEPALAEVDLGFDRLKSSGPKPVAATARGSARAAACGTCRQIWVFEPDGKWWARFADLQVPGAGVGVAEWNLGKGQQARPLGQFGL